MNQPSRSIPPRGRRARSGGGRPSILALCAAALLVALAACSGPAGPIAVHGTVMDVTQQPLVGLQVYLIGGAGGPQTTAADGSFAFQAVAVPFNLAVVDAATERVLVLRGLTRADPTVQTLQSVPAPRHVDVSGQIDGASVSAGQVGAVLVGGPGTGHGMIDIASGTSFAGSYEWYGPSTVPATLFGVVAEVDASGVPTAFHAFGSVATTVSDGATVSGVDVPLAPVSTAHVGGTLTAGPGVTLDQMVGIYVFRDGQRVASVTPSSRPASGTFDIALPAAAAASLTMVATGSTASADVLGWRAGLTAADSGIDLTLRAPAAASAPADGATGVAPDATFSWTTATDAVYVLNVNPDASGPSLTVVTASGEAALPDLSSLGIATPLAGAAYHWSVTTVGGYSSTDAATGRDGLVTGIYRVEAGAGEPTPADGWYAMSGNHGFTFAP